jgi:hypothetical protein
LAVIAIAPTTNAAAANDIASFLLCSSACREKNPLRILHSVAEAVSPTQQFPTAAESGALTLLLQGKNRKMRAAMIRIRMMAAAMMTVLRMTSSVEISDSSLLRLPSLLRALSDF